MSSTEVAVAGPRVTGSALVIDPQQNYWTDRQVGVLRQLGVKDASPADLAVFFHQALRTGLDPFAKQIYMIGRWSKEGTKQTIQTGIDGFRLIARRAADRAGETLGYLDTVWCGNDGVWRDFYPDDEPPAAARVTVLRSGQPFPATVYWSEFVQTTKDKATGDLVPTPMWARMGRNQLAKCAEAQALRKAFPQDLSGLYTDDEMGQPQDAPVSHAPARDRSGGNRLRAAVTTEPPVIEPDPPADEQAAQISPKQVTSLQILAQQKGFRHRDARLAWASQVVEFDLQSFSDLTAAEAANVRAALEELPDVDK